MGDMLIRNIPDAWKADIDALAKQEERSKSEIARQALRAGLDVIARRQAEEAEMPAGDGIHEIFKGVFGSNEEAIEFQQALDEVRRRDFGRPLPEFE